MRFKPRAAAVLEVPHGADSQASGDALRSACYSRTWCLLSNSGLLSCILYSLYSTMHTDGAFIIKLFVHSDLI